MTPPECPEVAASLPDRVVVGANGAYWRDYGDHYSMCPVSEDNDGVDVREDQCEIAARRCSQEVLGLVG